MLITILILFVIIAILLWRQQIFSDNKQLKNMPLSGLFIQPTSIHLTQKFVGKIIPLKTLDIFPAVSGFIEKVNVQENQSVHIGDTLFILQQRHYLVQKEVAQSQLENADKIYQQSKKILAETEQQKDSLSQIEIKMAQQQFEQAKNNLKTAQEKLKQAKINYMYTVIKSPVHGKISQIKTAIGNYVAPAGNFLARIIQHSPIRVVFPVNETDYLNFVEMEQGSFDTGTFKLILSNGQIYPITGIFQLMEKTHDSILLSIDFPNPESILKIGDTITVLFEKKFLNVIVLDKNLVHLTPNGAFVFLLKQNKIVRTPVITGLTLNNQYVILKGLKQNDFVLTEKISGFQIGKINTNAKQNLIPHPSESTN